MPPNPTDAIEAPLLERLDAVKTAREQADEDLIAVELEDGASPSDVARALLDGGLELLVLRPRAIDLEDAFLSLTEGKLA